METICAVLDLEGRFESLLMRVMGILLFVVVDYDFDCSTLHSRHIGLRLATNLSPFARN
jgi:hypothetical protein